MKKSYEIPLNVTMMGTVTRILLIFPVTVLSIISIVKFDNYILTTVPFYLLLTALISYDPIVHLYKKITHKAVYSTDPFLYNEELNHTAVS